MAQAWFGQPDDSGSFLTTISISSAEQRVAWQWVQVHIETPSVYVTLTPIPGNCSLFTANSTRPFVGDGVVVPGELGLSAQVHLHLVLFSQAVQQLGPIPL
jgi:hypothetical protein